MILTANLWLEESIFAVMVDANIFPVVDINDSSKMLCEKQSQVHQTDNERKESQGIHLLGLIYGAYNGIKNSSSLFFLT
jgi:hypothetical protein